MKTIPLTHGQVAIVDEDDYECLVQFKWYARWNKNNKAFYAQRRSPNSVRHLGIWILMHRVVMHATKGVKVDHIHGNTLDNRKSELRLCSNSQNLHNRSSQKNNTSGFKGVSLDRRDGKWRANIQVNGKSRSLGYFSTPEDASAAYQSASRSMVGEFSHI